MAIAQKRDRIVTAFRVAERRQKYIQAIVSFGVDSPDGSICLPQKQQSSFFDPFFETKCWAVYLLFYYPTLQFNKMIAKFNLPPFIIPLE